MIFSAQLAVSDLLYALTLPPLPYFCPAQALALRGEAAPAASRRFLFTCNLLEVASSSSPASASTATWAYVHPSSPTANCGPSTPGLSSARWLGASGPARCPHAQLLST